MYEDVCYEKPFLKEVIIRIDFAAPIEKLDKGVPSKLVNSVVKNFPIVEPADVLMHELSVDEDNALKSKQTAMKQWNYFSKERDRQLTIAPQFFFVQYRRYTKYEKTKEHFVAVVDALNSVFPGTLASRFGLRYINQIDLALDDPTKWDTYISANLVASRDFFEAGAAITRLITIAELRYGDVDVRFQFGLPNPDHPAPGAAPAVCT